MNPVKAIRGLLLRIRQERNSTVDDELELVEKELEEQEIRLQLLAMFGFVVTVASLRLLNASRLKALSGEHVLNMGALNDANLYKEVFMAYLNAALLEPVLAIGGMQEVVGQELVINIFTLGSICWWIWMVSDAFDYSDVCQHFKYHVDLREEAQKNLSKYSWLKLDSKERDRDSERLSLVGSLQRDVALWFSLASIGAAWLPGVVSHRDVVHAYVIVFLWLVLHHACRRATTWTTGYLITFLFPSTALMPMEYCLPLMDTFDFVEDLALVSRFREYVKDRTGVQLTIVS